MRLYAFCAIFMILASACGHYQGASDTPSDSKSEVDLWVVDSLAYQRWGSVESPYRDEARYVAFLDTLLAVDTLPDALRMRAELRRRIAMLNRPGSIANDFRFIERGGKEFHLHDLKSPLTLLIFYDPECPHCNEILRSYASSKSINRGIADKNLTVVAIYAEGKRDVWKRTNNALPQNWLVGYDLTCILDKELYDLPAMPTPYLLDNEKRVILKDPDIRQVIRGIVHH